MVIDTAHYPHKVEINRVPARDEERLEEYLTSGIIEGLWIRDFERLNSWYIPAGIVSKDSVITVKELFSFELEKDAIMFALKWS